MTSGRHGGVCREQVRHPEGINTIAVRSVFDRSAPRRQVTGAGESGAARPHGGAGSPAEDPLGLSDSGGVRSVIVGVVQSIYAAAGGLEGLLRLAEAWHRRVLADEVVSHAFSHGFHPRHSERLAAYWAQALGGPATYTDSYGDETSVVRMHSGNGPHEEMDRRAIECFGLALTDVRPAFDERLRKVLHDYFAWATTTTMSRYHDSADDVRALALPRWSWDGLQR